MIPLTPLQDIIYRKGMLDFKDKIIAELEQHYAKADSLHDEFDTEKSKEYLKALRNTISIVKTFEAK